MRQSPKQIQIPGPQSAAVSRTQLFERLQALMDGRLASLTLTANRSTILSSRPSRRQTGGFDLRLHGCFLEAGPVVLEAVASHALGKQDREGRRRTLAVLRRHFEEHRPAAQRRPAPRARLRSRGEHFDLEQVRQRINEAHFGGALTARITWGRAPGRRRRSLIRRLPPRRTLRLGSYDSDRDLIRIHPVLDDPRVPLPVIEAVVHHELLHAAMPVEVAGGRRRLHPPEFRRRERLFPHHAFTEAWLETHLELLFEARAHSC